LPSASTSRARVPPVPTSIPMSFIAPLYISCSARLGSAVCSLQRGTRLPSTRKAWTQASLVSVSLLP
jgi:hypothetical protein